MSIPNYFNFGGNRYKLEWVTSKSLNRKNKSYPKTKILGSCDHPYSRNRKIRIDKSLNGKDLLNTLCHEWQHSRFPMLCEDTVEDSATELSNFLWRLGYRRIEDVD